MKNFRWITDIVLGLRALGGEAALADLYRWIELNRHELPPEWKAAVRADLQGHCAEAKQYRPGNPDLFRRTGWGRWSIRCILATNVVKMSTLDLRSLAVQRMTSADFHEAALSGDPNEFLYRKEEQIKRELLQGTARRSD